MSSVLKLLSTVAIAFFMSVTDLPPKTMDDLNLQYIALYAIMMA